MQAKLVDDWVRPMTSSFTLCWKMNVPIRGQENLVAQHNASSVPESLESNLKKVREALAIQRIFSWGPHWLCLAAVRLRFFCLDAVAALAV